MLKNYFITALRSLRKNKISSVINVISLTITIVSCIFIFLYVWSEFNYDRDYSGSEKIFRIATLKSNPESTEALALTAVPLIPVVKEKYPEVELAARIFKPGRRSVVKYENSINYETGFIYADPEFVNLFSIRFLEGNPSQSLTRPYTVIVTKTIAEKYFGSQNPIGKLLFVDDEYYEVTGIIENPTGNTHLMYDIVSSTKSIPGIENAKNWTRNSCYSYIKLLIAADINAFTKKIEKLSEEYISEISHGHKFTYFVQPISDIHLYSNLFFEFEPGGNIQSIYIFIGVGLLLLLLGCMNFVNLATAQSSMRTKEVGMRKVIGAQKIQIIKQFISESLLLSLFSLLGALIIVIVLIPSFNDFTGKSISYSDLFGLNTVTLFIVLVFAIGIMAGFFPSWSLSNYSPIKTLKGNSTTKTNRGSLRKILVVSQFIISNLLVIGTVIMFQQLSYMKNPGLGFDKTQKLILPAGTSFTPENYEALKLEFTKYPSITSASVSECVFGVTMNMYGVFKVDQSEPTPYPMNHQAVDYDYLSDYNIQVIKGRSFDKGYSTDLSNACLINETACKTFGWTSAEEAIGKKISYDSRDNIRTIIGVVKDFHFASLHETIKPLFIDLVNNRTGWIEYLNLTVNVADIEKTIDFIKETWVQLNPEKPFSYFFLDEQFDLVYKQDEKLSVLCSVLTIIAIFIASFGLIGLISFTASQKTKEISVRKVLGASVSQLLIVLIKETAKCVAIANLLAMPIAYFFLTDWLNDFPYRISINFWTMFLSGIMILIIAFISVSVRCFKVAYTNPINSLRNE